MELVRQKNIATIVTFPIVDADGDIVTGATALDSEIDTWSDSVVPDGFIDCTNEATEIGATGIYYLSLTQAEMNVDYIYIQVKTTSVGAKTQHILIRTIVGDPLNIATTDDGGTINVTGGAIDTVTTLTGHTPQTGDSFPLVNTEVAEIYAAVITNAAGADIAADIIAVKADTASILLDTGTDGVILPQAQADKVWATAARVLTAGTNIVLAKGVGVTGFNDLSAAQVNTEVDTALSDIDLDHLIQVDAGVEEPTDGSYLDQIMHKAVGQTFDATTDSLEALRDTAPMGTAMRGTDNAALEANVETHVTNSLNTYDPPTKAELDTAASNIIAQVDANEVKIDIVDTNVDTLIIKVPDTISLANINAQMDVALDTAIPGVPTADSINERIKVIDDKLPSGTISDFDETANTVNLSVASEAQIDAIEIDTNALNDTKIPDILSLANINVQVDSALDTTIPGIPTPDSINERVKAIDDKLPVNYIMGSSVTTAKDDEIDAIKAKTDNLPADPADDSDIDAQLVTISSKIDAVDDYVDTEVAAIKAKTDQLQFTVSNVHAHVKATDVGGDATLANQTAILNRIGAFTGSGWNTILGFFRAIMRKDTGVTLPSDVGGTFDNQADSTEAIRDRGDAAWVTGGVVGANTVTITLKDTDTNGVIIPDAFITLRNNTGTTVLDRKTTDEDGKVIFSLDDGSYKLYIRKLGNYTFTTPEALTVLGDTVKEYYGIPFSPSAPGVPDTCIVYGWVINANGQTEAGVTIKAMIAVPPQLSAEQSAILTEEVSVITGIDGYFEITLLQGEAYYLVISDVSYAKKIEVPAQASVNYASL